MYSTIDRETYLWYVPSLHPILFLHVDLVDFPRPDQLQISLVAVLKVDEDVVHLREVRRLLGHGLGQPMRGDVFIRDLAGP